MNIVIVGAGKLGCKVAESLVVGDYSITVVDRNDKVLRKLSQHLDLMTINEDARKISVLICNVCISCTYRGELIQIFTQSKFGQHSAFHAVYSCTAILGKLHFRYNFIDSSDLNYRNVIFNNGKAGNSRQCGYFYI